MDSWQRTDERPPLKRWLNTKSNWTADVPRPEGPDAYRAIVPANLRHLANPEQWPTPEGDGFGRAKHAAELADKLRELVIQGREDVILEACATYRKWNSGEAADVGLDSFENPDEPTFEHEDGTFGHEPEEFGEDYSR